MGYFYDGTGVHGFLATQSVPTVPEPPTVLLLGAGVLVVACAKVSGIA